jgi:hypothetical protein
VYLKRPLLGRLKIRQQALAVLPHPHELPPQSLFLTHSHLRLTNAIGN